MICNFSTYFPWGKPTYFFAKILQGSNFQDANDDPTLIVSEKCKNHGERLDVLTLKQIRYPKIHTLRLHNPKRWRTGMTIHFYLWSRTERALCFGKLPVVSTQKVGIYPQEKRIRLYNNLVGLRHDLKGEALYEFVRNDGFDSPEDFWKYFNHKEPKLYTLIHWTDIRY